MAIFYIGTIILLWIGIGFDFAYTKRKKTQMDSRTNDYFVIAQSCKITSVCLLLIYLILLIFHLM